jgi:hypothetical protein
VLLSDCPGGEYLGINISGDSTSGSSTGGLSVNVSASGVINSAPEVILNGVDALLGPPTVSLCENITQNTIVHVDGAFSLYSFGIGSLSTFQTATAKISFSDQIFIDSPIATTLSVPASLAASGFAAESFGNTVATKGIVNATLTGLVNGSPFAGGNLSLESVTVIPEEAAIAVTDDVLIDVVPGRNIIDLAIEGEFTVIADAVPAGLFNLLSGSSTAGLTLPGSFEIGNFEMADGSSLPIGMSIVSANDGSVYVAAIPEPSAFAALSVIGCLAYLLKIVVRRRPVSGDSRVSRTVLI